MWRHNKVPYGILIVAGVSVTLQIVGFSSLNWLTVETFYQESHIKSPEGTFMGTSDMAAAQVSKPDGPTDQEGISLPGEEAGNNRLVQPAVKGDSSVPPNEQPVESGGVSAPDNGNRKPTDKKGLPLPANNGNRRPTDTMGLPLPANNGNRRPTDKVGLPLPGNNGNRKPTDKVGLPLPANNGNRKPTDKMGLPLPANNGNRKPTDKMGLPLPANTGNRKPTDKMGDTTLENGGNRKPSDKMSVAIPENVGNGWNMLPLNETKQKEHSQVRGKMTAKKSLPLSKGDQEGDMDTATAYRTLTFITVGLWTARRCSMENQVEYCQTIDAEKGLYSVFLWTQQLVVYDLTVSTWHSLRVETVMAVIFCLIGLAGIVLGVKPLCLGSRKRAIVVIGIGGMGISAILYFVAVSRAASINESLKAEFRELGDSFVVHAPWGAAVGGVGACLALVAAGLQGVCMWLDERRKWSKFQNEVVFAKTPEGSAPAPSADHADITSCYDNRAARDDTQT